MGLELFWVMIFMGRDEMQSALSSHYLYYAAAFRGKTPRHHRWAHGQRGEGLKEYYSSKGAVLVSYCGYNK